MHLELCSVIVEDYDAAIEFYQRVWQHYQEKAAWRSQTLDAYVGRHERRPIALGALPPRLRGGGGGGSF